jgi:hypothetical protein
MQTELTARLFPSVIDIIMSIYGSEKRKTWHEE